MANQSPRPTLPISVPVNFPTTPIPGKIQILYDVNKRALYHKLSPYGSETFFGIKTRQPFLYTYPDEVKKTSDFFIVDLVRKSAQDVERVSKFMISKGGLTFLTNQFLMQTGNAFNETRLYNPTSPIVAAGMPITLWAARPQRNIDTSDLLGSFLGSAGKFIGGLFGTGTKPPSPPAGTIGRALPSNSTTAQIGAKGLLRAGTANAATTLLTNKWTVQKGGGFNIGGFLLNTLKGMFGNFLPQTQNATARSDEITYGLMLGSSTGENGAFTYQGINGQINGVQQFWFGGSAGLIRKKGETPLNWKKIYISDTGQPVIEVPSLITISGLTGQVGYTVNDISGPVKYGDYVGTSHKDDWDSSDELIQFSKYSKESTKYSSKLNDEQNASVVAINASLQKVIDSIEKSGIYAISVSDSSVLMNNQDPFGYNRIVAMKKHLDTEEQYQHSVLEEYRKNVRVLENQHTNDPSGRSKKMASSRQFDGINTLKVLDKTKMIDNGLIPGWTTWRPYHDDQIAFYFYDVVNEKYIPFRAIIRGLQETDSATWEELSFIGRADRLYSYSGYNRSLTFGFTVHISSLIELSPTWQRINYLMSLVKPSRYTTIKDERREPTLRQRSGEDKSQPAINLKSLSTKFIVPPMVMVTIGDLYKNQPIVLGSVGISIPDTAIWETLNQNNSDEWSYLVNYIKAPNIGKLYGQLPLTAELSVNAYILEQERAIVGAAHFGSAPHDEGGGFRPVAPDFSNTPSDLHKSLIVDNSQPTGPQPPPTPTPTRINRGGQRF